MQILKVRPMGTRGEHFRGFPSLAGLVDLVQDVTVLSCRAWSCGSGTRDYCTFLPLSWSYRSGTREYCTSLPRLVLSVWYTKILYFLA